MKRLMVWLLAGILSIAMTALVFMPAAWMAPLLEERTMGRLTLGDAQGTVWNGSAFVGVASGNQGPVTPLLPGRFSWQLSPTVLLGQVDLHVENPAALSQPLSVAGNWHQWQVSPAAVLLPAERLAGLGAPLNTIQPSGQMRLSWGALLMTRHDNNLEIMGQMNLEMNDIASRLSPVKPLGSYNLAFDWRGTHADLKLSTNRGAMLLNGAGALRNGRLQFSGVAEAAEGHEDRLANLLNLLGQRRTVGGKDVIALEFK